mmetsp:Transcript_17847/g.51951  ORF Transcript_17847/g.51951 Transcript_17847/m.51951 type:complete len:334 (+) Transcript_17847:562-1563(+)
MDRGHLRAALAQGKQGQEVLYLDRARRARRRHLDREPQHRHGRQPDPHPCQQRPHSHAPAQLHPRLRGGGPAQCLPCDRVPRGRHLHLRRGPRLLPLREDVAHRARGDVQELRRRPRGALHVQDGPLHRVRQDRVQVQDELLDDRPHHVHVQPRRRPAQGPHHGHGRHPGRPVHGAYLHVLRALDHRGHPRARGPHQGGRLHAPALPWPPRRGRRRHSVRVHHRQGELLLGALVGEDPAVELHGLGPRRRLPQARDSDHRLCAHPVQPRALRGDAARGAPCRWARYGQDLIHPRGARQAGPLADHVQEGLLLRCDDTPHLPEDHRGLDREAPG